MHSPQISEHQSEASQPFSVRELHRIIEDAAHYLPAQGPITAFVHHNTLHSFEHLPFDLALEEASQIYGCDTYLNQADYWRELGKGRIQTQDIECVLRAEMGQAAETKIGEQIGLYPLFLKILLSALPSATPAEIQWLMSTGDGIKSFHTRCAPEVRRQMVAETRQWVMRELRPHHIMHPHLKGISQDIFSRWQDIPIEKWQDSTWEEVTLTLLWHLCRQGVHGLKALPADPTFSRLQTYLKTEFHEDPDLLVHELLISFCAAFTDQGISELALPWREAGFYRAFSEYYSKPSWGFPAWLKKLPPLLQQLQGQKPEEIILSCLHDFGIQNHEIEVFLKQSLLALRGWAGMLWQLETRPDRVNLAPPPGTLVEFLAVRLLLDRLACEYICQEKLALKVSLADLRKKWHHRHSHPPQNQRAYTLFLLAQSLGWSPQSLVRLSPTDWQNLISEIENFTPLKRRRLLHSAYERRFRIQVLDTISAFQAGPQKSLPTLQVICCIDEREESFRRHLEELNPQVETFGFAGFFGVPMYYQGLEDIHEMPLCPVIIRPIHHIQEKVMAEDQSRHARGALRLRQVGLASHHFQRGSHGFLAGIATTFLGALSAVPLVASVLFPRFSAQFRKFTGKMLKTPVKTELALEAENLPENPEAPRMGFTWQEMTQIVKTVLENLGLTQNFSRLIVIIGHGSSSLNNPHEAAHDCGACGGGRGGPNARAFAQMANHPKVRQALAAQGIAIPAESYFLGAYHNTCDDSMTYYDLKRLPDSHQTDYQAALTLLDQACDYDAHERCRRFENTPLFLSPDEARKHVEGRAEDLAQPRPEYGHATNAMLIVGRRERTRGLYLDRRAFLFSYDPMSEMDNPESPILTRILQAGLPVCSGINLEYYFSFVSPRGWGCGTKLPHNITAMLGVMDGASSDLRPGLPWQMVEIHEPVRLVTVVETTPEKLMSILNRNPGLKQLCVNQWIWIATLDPHSSQIHFFEAGEFKPYQPESTNLPQTWPSTQWYEGLREHLSFAASQPHEAKP